MIAVDATLAAWAQAQARTLERVFTELDTTDIDLDALTGLRLIAEAVA